SEGADHEVRRPSDSKSRADRGPRRRRGPGLAVDEPPAVMPSLPLWPFDESPTAGGRLPEPPSEPLTTLDPWIDGAHFSGNMAVSVPREFDYKREEFSEKAVVDLSERNWREPNRSWALADEPAGVEID